MALSDFFFDTQNPNPNPNPNPNTKLERQMGDVLCILAYDRVLVIDMDYILMDEDYKQEEGMPPSLKRLPVKRTLDSLKNRLAVGMGLAKWGNCLYMFGGVNPSQRDYLVPNPLLYGLKLPVEDLPCPAYMFDLADDQSEPVPLASMLGPKLYPIVEVIGDNIYVLSKMMLSDELPMFEVFHPETGKWRTLPQPLPPSSGDWQVVHYSVCGSVIACSLSTPFTNFFGSYARFNTITEEWEYPEDITTRQRICMHADPDVQYEDVYYTFGEDDGFYAMTATSWPDIYPLLKGEDGYSIKFEPSDIYPHLGIPFYISGILTLADPSDQMEYMCGLVLYDDDGDEDCYYTIGQALYVIVFQVGKLEPDKVPSPLSIRYLRRQVYEFKREDEQQLPYFDIKKAIIGRVYYNVDTGSSECSGEEQGGGEEENKKRKREREEEEER